MTADHYARPALGRDEVRQALRRASVAALEYARALVELEDPGSSVISLADLEEAFMLRCRDVTRAVEALPYADRPRGWRTEQ